MSILEKLFRRRGNSTNSTATAATATPTPCEPNLGEFFPIIELKLGAVLDGKRCECSRSLQAQETLNEFLANHQRLSVKFDDGIVHAWHAGRDLGILRGICRRPGFLLEVEYDTRRKEEYTSLVDRGESGIVRKSMLFCE